MCLMMGEYELACLKDLRTDCTPEFTSIVVQVGVYDQIAIVHKVVVGVTLATLP